jgi:hypothetical protein
VPHRDLIAALVTTAHARAGRDAQRRLGDDLSAMCWPSGVADRHDPLARLNLRISLDGLMAIEPGMPCSN